MLSLKCAVVCNKFHPLDSLLLAVHQVSKVWNAVDNQARKQHTSIIHGKYSHEETVATASFAQTYLVVRDLNEVKYLCNYILNGGNREEFLHKFRNAVSEGALGIAAFLRRPSLLRSACMTESWHVMVFSR